MKTINVTFEDDEHELLLKLKSSMDCDSWRQFILSLAKYTGENVEENE